MILIHGRGLHRGEFARVELRQRRADFGGIWFKAGVHESKLGLHLAQPKTRQTVLKLNQDCCVQTVEHLLAAIHGLRLTNIEIDVLEGTEIPLLDGSAKPFVDALQCFPKVSKETYFELKEAIELREGDSICRLSPAEKLTISADIDFSHPAIGKQHYEFGGGIAEFIDEIASARSFGFLKDANELWKEGLAQGATMDNLLVFDEEKPCSKLRYDDEPVRHKILDTLGDLMLLGAPLHAHVDVIASSHRLMIKTLRLAHQKGLFVFIAQLN